MTTIYGTSQEVHAIAQGYLSALSLPAYRSWTFADLAPLATKHYMAPLGVNGTMVPVDILTDNYALILNERGWGLYAKDYSASSKSGWALKSGISGGTNPFANIEMRNALALIAGDMTAAVDMGETEQIISEETPTTTGVTNMLRDKVSNIVTAIRNNRFFLILVISAVLVFVLSQSMFGGERDGVGY